MKASHNRSVNVTPLPVTVSNLSKILNESKSQLICRDTPAVPTVSNLSKKQVTTSELLSSYIEKYDWKSQEITQHASVNAKSGERKAKIEVLTANYPI